jgi:hypothetical protein
MEMKPTDVCTTRGYNFFTPRYLNEIQFANLGQQLYVLANTLPDNMQIQITDVELSPLFGHSAGQAQGPAAWGLHHADSENPTARGRSKAVDSDNEEKLRAFCLVRQSERNPVTFQDAIDFMHDNRVQVDRFWVRRFPERNGETLTL